MSLPARKPARIEDAGQAPRVPRWMQEHKIGEGEYVHLTKAQLQKKQQPGNTLRMQIWATGMLHSPGYKGELAQTTLPGGEVVAMTPGLIGEEIAKVALEFYEERGIATDVLIEKAPAELLSKFEQPLAPKARRRVKIRMLRRKKEDIRSEMEELEREGSLERRHADGRLLRDLSPEERRRVPSAKIRLFFFLRPKSADMQIVDSEWESTMASHDRKKLEVGKSALPPRSVRRILGMFGVLDQVDSKKLSDPEYQKAIEAAYKLAKKLFLETLEIPEKVVPESLPQEESAAPPEVGLPVGLLKYKGEGEIEEIRPRRAGGPSSVQQVAPETVPAPPAARPDRLVEGLTKRRLLPDGELLDAIRYVIGEMPLREFWDVLDDRVKRGRIGTGLLMAMARKARAQWEANAPPAAAAPSQADQVEALRWMAAEDPDPEARSHAAAELRRLGIEPNVKAAGGES